MPKNVKLHSVPAILFSTLRLCVASSRDKILYVGPSTHTWGYGKFVNARYARFTNSNAKLRLRLRLHLDFLPSLRSGKKPAIRP